MDFIMILGYEFIFYGLVKQKTPRNIHKMTL